MTLTAVATVEAVMAVAALVMVAAFETNLSNSENAGAHFPLDNLVTKQQLLEQRYHHYYLVAVSVADSWEMNQFGKTSSQNANHSLFL
jgi:hypothetical protein